MEFPNHEYSKYMDPQFNYNNVVYPTKEEVVDKLKNMRCDGNIMLEPRLQEYLKKKKYYKEMNVKPCVSPEKEYQITNRDKKMLKEFLKGDTEIYDQNHPKFNYKRRTRTPHKKCFDSKYLLKDPRVPKLNHPEMVKPANMGMFVPERGETFYEGPLRDVDPVMDSRDFTGDGFSLNETRFDPRVDPRMYPGQENQNKYTSQFKVESGLMDDPRIGRKNREISDPDPRNRNIISDLGQGDCNSSYKPWTPQGPGNVDNYQFLEKEGSGRVIDELFQDLEPSRYGAPPQPKAGKKAELDYNSGRYIPDINVKHDKDLSSYDYRMTDFFNTKNVTEAGMVNGMPTRTQKSYGYRNPEEHYFQYLDPNFQNADNTVEPWGPRGGDSSRLANTQEGTQLPPRHRR